MHVHLSDFAEARVPWVLLVAMIISTGGLLSMFSSCVDRQCNTAPFSRLSPPAAAVAAASAIGLYLSTDTQTDDQFSCKLQWWATVTANQTLLTNSSTDFQSDDRYNYPVSRKTSTFLFFLNKSVKNWPILVIFGKLNPKKVWHEYLTYLSTLPM